MSLEEVSVRTLLRRTWELLEPFHRPYLRFLVGVIARQVLLVLGGYSLVWLVHQSMGHTSVPIWVFIGGLLIYDAGLLRLNLLLNTSFVKRVSFPLFGHLRSKALGKLFDMPLEWHLRQQSGALSGKINDSVGKVVQTAEGFSRELAPALIQTGLTLIPLLYFSPWTVAFVAGALVVFAFITIAENKERRPYRKARHENYANDFGMFSECIDYVQLVVHFGQTERILEKYRDLQRQIATQGIEEVEIGARYASKRNMLLSIAKRACQGLWLWQFRAGGLDAAMVMYLNTLIEDLFNSFSGYAGLIERLYDGIEPTRTLLTLLDEKPAIASDSSKKEVDVPKSAGIEIEQVHFAYGEGPAILRDFTLTIEPGEVLGIVGRSGIGKTTLQQLLSRVYDVQGGRILVAGKDIREWPLEQLRGLFSSVTQAGGVFFSNSSILETIRFARPNATVEQVLEAARCACIHSEILRMPDGYATKVGQRGVTLSKGQQQRIALAQALLALDNGRKVVILDEFTSALDSKTEQQVLNHLIPKLNDKTVIIIAHRLATLRKIADRIVVLDETGIVEAGDHAELLLRGGAYAEIARLQATA